MSTPKIAKLGLIAGKGLYPRLVLDEARKAGGIPVALAAFEGETAPELAAAADRSEWLRVGQIGKMLKFFKEAGVTHAMMAGQISPQRLFDLRPDFKALMLLAKLKERNAESIFGAIADELAANGIELLPAVTFLENHLVREGLSAGPDPARQLQQDIEFGWAIAKQVSDLNIGQTIIVKKGTVLAVEGYDGTNETIRRGGGLGKGGATMIKVAKRNQDMRFDVPVIGPDTLRIAGESGISAIVCEAKKTLLLGSEELRQLARSHRVSVWGHEGLK